MKKILLLLTTLNILSSLCKAQTCNNWLSTPSLPSYMSAGQINVTGQKITVEAYRPRPLVDRSADPGARLAPMDCRYVPVDRPSATSQ